MVASSDVSTTGVTNRAIGAVSFVLGVITVTIGAFSSSVVVAVPVIQRDLGLGLAAVQQLYDLATVLELLVALVAVVLGVIGVWRTPRSSLAAWGIGAGGTAVILVGFGLVFTAIINNLVAGGLAP